MGALIALFFLQVALTFLRVLGNRVICEAGEGNTEVRESTVTCWGCMCFLLDKSSGEYFLSTESHCVKHNSTSKAGSFMGHRFACYIPMLLPTRTPASC